MTTQPTIPLPPVAVSAIKRWLKSAPASEIGLAFPNGVGKVESYTNIYHRLWVPLMAAADLVDVTTDTDKDTGKTRQTITPRFALHTLRHVACSLWIEQECSPKKIQTWAGHASSQFTLDRYGHLWTDETTDHAVTRAIEKSITG